MIDKRTCTDWQTLNIVELRKFLRRSGKSFGRDMGDVPVVNIVTRCGGDQQFHLTVKRTTFLREIGLLPKTQTFAVKLFGDGDVFLVSDIVIGVIL